MESITPGRIVEFFPNGSKNYQLPNNMESAPAIVTQAWTGTDKVNMNIQVAESRGGASAIITAWSIGHKSEDIPNGMPYWDWYPKV
jgi:hypothetical protein